MGNMLWTQGLINRGIMPEICGSIASGSNKLDYTSDNAFIEFGVDISMHQGSGMIEVIDSADKSAQGYLHSLAPSGETLGSEIGG